MNSLDYKMADLDLLVQHGGDRLYITFKQIKVEKIFWRLISKMHIILEIFLFPTSKRIIKLRCSEIQKKVHFFFKLTYTM